MGVVFSALSVLAMVKTSRMVAAAVTIGGISTYQGIVIELRLKESDLKLKRKWKKWKSVGEMELNGGWWPKAVRQRPTRMATSIIMVHLLNMQIHSDNSYNMN